MRKIINKINEFFKNNEKYFIVFIILAVINLVAIILSVIFNLNVDINIGAFSQGFNFSFLKSGLNLSFPIFYATFAVFAAYVLFLLPNIYFVNILFFCFLLATRYLDVLGFIFLALFLIKVVIKIINKKEKAKLIFPYFPYFLLFLSSAIISVINSKNYLFSFIWIGILIFLYFGYIFLPANIINSGEINKNESIKNVFKVLSILGIIGILFGIFSLVPQFFSTAQIYGAKTFPIFGIDIFGNNRNTLAQVLIVSIISILFLYYFEKDKRRKIVYLIFAIACCVFNVLTFSRNASLTMTASIAGILFLFNVANYKNKKDLKKFFYSTFVILLCSLILLKSIFFFYAKANRAEYDGSIKYRVGVAKVSLEIFKKHPIIGTGFGMYRGEMGSNLVYQEQYSVGSENTVTEAHSSLQKILLEQGIFGVVAYLLFLFVIFFDGLLFLRNKKNKKEDKAIMVFCMILAFSQVFYNLFDMMYYTFRMWGVLGLLVAINIKNSKNKK